MNSDMGSAIQPMAAKKHAEHGEGAVQMYLTRILEAGLRHRSNLSNGYDRIKEAFTREAVLIGL